MKQIPLETMGQRVARLRQQFGWTQEQLAVPCALSRVAVSHIELDLITPSERTVILLAGLFKLAPAELVAGTTYPQAKAERLPPTCCAFTPAELELALLERDLWWLRELDGIGRSAGLTATISGRWLSWLAGPETETLSAEMKARAAAARAELLALRAAAG